MEFFEVLKMRNPVLFWFGFANLLAVLVLVGLGFTKQVEYAGTNAWWKPTKFALATVILSWSLGWYTGYLSKSIDISITNWIIVITLGFEVLYIAWQAGRGQASHYNVTTPFYAAMFSLMALAASIATLAVAYISIKFFTESFPNLPDYYLWAIRSGMLLFVVFSFEGFAMGTRMAHTVGGIDGGKGLPFLNWSRTLGDLRIAHFIGMHALQVLPLLAWYVLKDIKWTFVLAALYTILAIYVLLQALQAKPFLRFIQ
ncbi:MAG: hypothetical protein ACFB0B_00815 [Thermonemataceae bacterium]